MASPRTPKTGLLRDWLSEAPFTLALSSSFFGFYAHCGIAAALFEAGLVPAKVTGASAGALVAGALASGLSPAEMAEICFALAKEDFWDPGLGLGYLKGKKFAALLERHFVKDFSQTKIPLEVAVFDVLKARTVFLKSGPLIPAVVASCAVPMLFHPVRIGNRLYLDGGIFEKPGFRAPAAERVLCAFLTSQGWAGAYEVKTTSARFKANHKALRFDHLPSVRPHDLASGAKAFDAAYSRTRAALNQPSRGGVLAA
ncbi:MAG: patatin [Proteobacteria bacterium]|nr:MAG: patatin [Pseudomonadota bacterium]